MPRCARSRVDLLPVGFLKVKEEARDKHRSNTTVEVSTVVHAVARRFGTYGSVNADSALAPPIPGPKIYTIAKSVNT